MVIHKDKGDGVECGRTNEQESYMNIATEWIDVDCPECMAELITGEKSEEMDDDFPTREDMTLTEIVYSYNRIIESGDFKYELKRLALNANEISLLIEFLHCKAL